MKIPRHATTFAFEKFGCRYEDTQEMPQPLLLRSRVAIMKIPKKCHNLAFKKLGGRYEDTQEMPQSLLLN